MHGATVGSAMGGLGNLEAGEGSTGPDFRSFSDPEAGEGSAGLRRPGLCVCQPAGQVGQGKCTISHVGLDNLKAIFLDKFRNKRYALVVRRDLQSISASSTETFLIEHT